MSAPQSRLTSTFGHYLGESQLAEAMLQWKPTSIAEERCLVDELLSHARAAANVLNGILEHWAVTIDNGGGQDIADAADVWGLSDLTATLIEIISVIRRREYDCPEDCDTVAVTLECD